MTRPLLAVSCLLAITCGQLAPAACSADAQAPPDHVELTTLVRAVVAEADWSAVDHAGILHALRSTGPRQGRTAAEQALRYVSAYRRLPAASAWKLQLEPACAQPEAWPSNLAWARYERRCLATFQRVRAFLAGELPDPCGAHHWGSRVLAADVRRAARAVSDGRWVHALCSRAASAFFREQ